MQIAYTSQNFTLKQCGHISRFLSLMPEYISHPRIAMGTMGSDDGNGGMPWTKEYYHTMFSGYRVLDRWVFPLSLDINFTRNYAIF
jgi:hypothetical protein